ncbi:hypothetical protein COOONC_24123 [Cooperia oncophora]
MAPLPLMDLTKRSFFSVREGSVIETLQSLDAETFYCTVDGEIVTDFLGRLNDLPEDAFFQLHFRVLGGKGGFGSLLRSFRVNKSTNQLMCRDLNGRRLASIDEEQRLKKWIERAAEREKEKLAKRKAKYEKLKSGPPKHMFDDPDYMRQKETIIEKTEEAFEQGFLEALKAEREKKEKPVESSEDEEDDSSSDSEENDVDPELLREIQDYFAAQKEECTTSKQDDNTTTSSQNGKSTALEGENSCVSEKGDGATENACMNVEQQPEPAGEKPPEPAGEKPPEPAKEKLPEPAKEKPSEPVEFPAVDLSQYESPDQLETLGLNHLKHALLARGMKCGGTLRRQREERVLCLRGRKILFKMMCMHH